mgnify:CR=1 FL=1
MFLQLFHDDKTDSITENSVDIHSCSHSEFEMCILTKIFLGNDD